MGDKDTPNVEITLDEEDLNPGPSEYTFMHLSEFDSDAERSFGEQMHLYVFDSDDMREQLKETIIEERNEYNFVHGVVVPDEAREIVSKADTEDMRALEWAVAILPYMNEYDTEDIESATESAKRYLDLG